MNDFPPDEHNLTISTWMEDHKRGWGQPSCACGWQGQTRHISRTVWSEEKERFVGEWRDHLPADHLPAVGSTVEADGSVRTGQALVAIKDSDTMILALSTHLTATALVVHGFWWGEVGSTEDATDYVFPAANVQYVNVTPWWDKDDIFETDMEKPDEAVREEVEVAADL